MREKIRTHHKPSNN